MKRYQPPAEEQVFLDSFDPNRYPKPSVTMDTVILKVTDGRLRVLLIRRGDHPYRGCWALPGGFLELEGDTDTAEGAARELAEETGLSAERMIEIGVFGRRGRDPRDRTVTVAYLALASEDATPEAGDDASATGWFDVSLGDEGEAVILADDEVSLAFDHEWVIAKALRELAWRAKLAAPFLELIDPSWTVSRALSLLRATGDLGE
jgi:8-oxo-dGTP diphosphatase